MKIFQFLLLLLGVFVISEACHHGTSSNAQNNFERRKRSAPRGPDARKDLSDYFTGCMQRKNQPDIIPVMRSVIDFVLRDTIWYKASDQYFCRDEKDTAGCWNGVTDLLIDWDSVMLGPARECILAYGIDPRSGQFSGGYRGKRSSASSSNAEKKCPRVSDSVYGTCIVLEVNDTRSYPSLDDLHWKSIAIFVREHMSRCGVEEFVQDWDGKTAYRRKCGDSRYKGANGEKVQTAQEQCLPFLLDEVIKEEAPLKPGVTTCNEIYRDTSYGDDFIVDPGSEIVGEPLDPDGEFEKYGPRGKHDGADIVGYCDSKSNFTRWYDDTNNQTGDKELLVELRARYPNEICSRPQGIQIRISRNDEPYYTSGNHLVAMAPDVGLECRNSMQHGDRKCENFKVRFCCLGTSTTTSNYTGQNSGTGNVPVLSPLFIKTVDTVGTCGPTDRWGPWKNIDSKQGDGGDFEYVWQYGQSGCQPVAIQGRLYATKKPYTEARNNLRSADPTTGIVCSDDMQPKDRPCADLEVRLCCKDGKGVPIIQNVL